MPEAARGNGKDTVATNHGCTSETTTDKCSDNVIIDGVGIVRLGDTNASHIRPVGDSCIPHTVALSTSSLKVLVNDRGAGRKGDKYGNEEITTGYSKVVIG